MTFEVLYGNIPWIQQKRNITMEQNKYIFLDIDGVLVSKNCSQNFDELSKKSLISLCIYGWVNKLLLHNLYEIIDKSNAKVIGVSSWFCLISDDDIKIIENVLGLKIHDVASSSGGIHRGLDILKWLEKKHYDMNKDCFVIIDDAGSRCYAYPTLLISGETGLTKNYVNKALGFLDMKQDIRPYLKMQKNHMGFE